MADTLVRVLACLHLVQAITPKVPDNAVGYSRIVVASPGVRKYTYDIAHDPEGRDFSINFNPLDTGLDLDNFLQEPQAYPQPEAKYLPRAVPQYHQFIPVNENFDEIQLHIKHPNHEEMEKSSKAIQTVHAAYSKKPPQPHPPMNVEEFDLGIMGYSDFMDPHDEPRANQQSYPVEHTPPPRPPKLYTPNYGLKQIAYRPRAKIPYLPKQKISYSKVAPQQPLVQKFENPAAQYGTNPTNFERALFVPAFDEGRLKGLADKAYSKVFMAQGYAKPVARYYPKNGPMSEGLEMAKTLFVPVVILPSTPQTLVDKQSIDRSSIANFEAKRVLKKRA